MRTIGWPTGTWDAFGDLYGIRNELNRVFDNRGLSGGRFPPTNAWVAQDKVIVEMEAPGLDIEKVDVSVDTDRLAVSGERTRDQSEDSGSFHRTERETGSFKRAFRLPFRADAAKVNAVYRNGILRIELERMEEEKPRQIKVKAG